MYDPEGLFEKRVNPETLTWQRVAHPHWQGGAAGPGGAALGRDAEPLRGRRCCTTGMPDLPHFWQVVPKEYAKYLPVPMVEAEALRA